MAVGLKWKSNAALPNAWEGYKSGRNPRRISGIAASGTPWSIQTMKLTNIKRLVLVRILAVSSCQVLAVDAKSLHRAGP